MNQTDLSGKKVLVVGIGRSGLAVARFLKSHGAEVTITDRKNEEELGGVLKDLPKGISVAAGTYPVVTKKHFDYVVTSPGVPLTESPLRQAMENGVPLLGELELAYRFSNTPIVAVTGTNGKTTTTTLTGEIFSAAGYNVLVGGNIGLPLVSEVENYTPEDIIVAEVSSFQLECIEEFRPKVSMLLNFAPDHLDRHGTMENYIEAKARVFENQDINDYAVLNYDDSRVRNLADQVNAQVIFFSRQHKLETGVYVHNGRIVADLGRGRQDICSVEEIFIRGSHNLENALAATAAALVLGVKAEVIVEVLRKFHGVVHRMEYVAEIDGVTFVNDSKGTNPEAAIKAIDSYKEPIILIAGGRNKGSDFTTFMEKVKENVKELVVLGECKEEIIAAAKEIGYKNIHTSELFEESIKLAAGLADKGEVVLLSPACASWDMFKNFEQRGDKFKEVVLSLRR